MSTRHAFCMMMGKLGMCLAALCLGRLAWGADAEGLESRYVMSAPEEKAKIIETLLKEKDSRAFAVLFTALCDREVANLRERVFERLRQGVTQAHFDLLCKAIEDVVPENVDLVGEKEGPDRDAQAYVIRLLGAIGDARAEPVLLRLLACDHPTLRVACIQALGTCGGDRTAPVLKELLTDKYEAVATEAALALMKLGDAETARVLIEKWTKAKGAIKWGETPMARKRGQEFDKRMQAELATLPARGLPALVGALAGVNWASAAWDITVLDAYLHRIEEMTDAENAAELLPLVAYDNTAADGETIPALHLEREYPNERACDLILARGDAAARSRLLQTATANLDAKSPRLRAVWLRAFGVLSKDTQAVAKILKEDTSWRVRVAAARALVQMNTDEAREALKPFREDPDPDVREAVNAGEAALPARTPCKGTLTLTIAGGKEGQP